MSTASDTNTMTDTDTSTATSVAAATAPTTKRRARRKRTEFRFQLIRCVDPNRSVARIEELKTKGLSSFHTTLFQLKDVLDNKVLKALVDFFQYCVSEGIKWRTLDLQEDRNSTRYNPLLLKELLQLTNTSNMFQNVQLTVNGSTRNGNFAVIGADPPNDILSILPSIEQNTRLLKLSIDFKGRLSNEDIQSLVTLLKVAKKLKRLEIRSHGFRIEDYSEGFASNSTLVSLTIQTQLNSMTTGSSTMRAMLMELSRHSTLKLQKLMLSGSTDADLSTPLEALLVASQTLKNVNVQCHPPTMGFSFPDPPNNNNNGGVGVGGGNRAMPIRPSGSSPFDAFFHRLSKIAPPNSSNYASMPNSYNQMEVDGGSDSDELQQQRPSLDQYLSEQGPLITIGSQMYNLTAEQIATAQQALVNYPRLRLTAIHPPADLAYYNLLNNCGRYLMYRRNVPLGLWPIALERAACLENHKRQRSSIIYELLHGGVFAAREAYASM